jgi:hypothetical protein
MGPAGPQGPQGVAGTDGTDVAGLACPSSYPFLHGFDAAGSIVCINSSGATKPPDPPPGPPAPDVVFLVDSTADMANALNVLRYSIVQQLIPAITAQHPGTNFGVAEFRDFPLSPYGQAGDIAYRNVLALTQNISLVNNALYSMAAAGGADPKESGHEALYQVATGTGLSPFIAPTPMGFRAGVAHIVIVVSSAEFHDATDYGSAVTGAHSFAQALVGLGAQNVKVMGLAVASAYGGNPALQQLRAYAQDTGAILSPEQLGSVGTCPTGLNGAPTSAVNGLCHLTFQSDVSGAGVPLSVLATAVHALAASP